MKKSVLIVDDEPLTLHGFASAMRKAGWTVKTADNGLRALTALRSGRHFDALVLDVRLPDMSGFDVLGRARQDRLRLPPVLVVSAYLDDEAFQRFVTEKARVLLPKPIAPSVVAALADALRTGSELGLINVLSPILQPIFRRR